MMKTTLTHCILGLLFGLGPLSLSASSAVCPLGAAVLADTIPTVESFDEPLDQQRVSDRPVPDFFASQAKERKVIPIASLETDTSLLLPRPVPKGYTGFKIEVMASSTALPAGHDLFFQHGNIMLEELGEEQFSYTLGDFKTRAEAEKFMEELLIGRYPEAKVAAYVEGVRQPE